MCLPKQHVNLFGNQLLQSVDSDKILCNWDQRKDRGIVPLHPINLASPSDFEATVRKIDGYLKN